MTTRREDYEVGYGKPPKHTRWKAGESGNRTKQHRRRPKNTVTLIDELFLSSIDVTIDGERRKIPILEAIMMQLLKLELSGNRRALRTRQKYEDFARRFSEQALETVFVDSAYTRAMAASSPTPGEDHE